MPANLSSKLNAGGKRPGADLVLIRAGATAWDEQRRLQGRTDLPLCEGGRVQADAAARLVGAAGDLASRIGVVHYAPDDASRETAQAVASQLGVKIRKLPGVASIGLGLWEGMRDEELLSKHTRSYKQWRDDPSLVLPPEGESLIEAEVRMGNAIRRVLDKAGRKAVAIVARPLVIEVISALVEDRAPRGVATLEADLTPPVAVLEANAGLIRDRLESLKISA
jgi:broad specificity phosphatase PhoE